MPKQKKFFLKICHKKQKQTTIYNQTNLKNDGCVLSDSMFIYAIDEAVKLRAAHKDSIGPTYFYVNTYPGKMTLANMAHDGSYRRPTWDALKGASHGSGVAQINAIPKLCKLFKVEFMMKFFFGKKGFSSVS